MGRSALIISLLAAAACNSFTSTGGNSPRRPDGGTVCLDYTLAPTACPAGFTCANGDCVPTCDGGACQTGMYCEGQQPTLQGPTAICAPLAPIICGVNTDCPAPQNCLAGLCSALQTLRDGGAAQCTFLTSDGGYAYPEDGCAPDAICGQSSSGKECFGMPPCAQNGTCPVNIYGTVCNQLADGGVLNPSKQRVCLIGYCLDNTNCPQGTNVATECFRYTLALPYGGRCQLGQAGDSCFTASDCRTAPQCVGAKGALGDGGTPGACACADGGTTPPCQ